MNALLPKLPKYVQLAEHLRNRIQGGLLQSGDQLPSLAQLNTEFGTSQSTADRAHAILERDGLIVRAQGRGVFVADTPRRAVTGTLGYVLPPPEVNLQFPYYARLMNGIRAVAAREKFEIMLLGDTPSAGWEKVDGALLFGESRRDLPRKLPVPMPLVGLMVSYRGLPSVRADDYRGMREATEYLVGLGHRRIAYLTDALWVPKNTPLSGLRLRGYQDALREAGIKADEKWLFDLHIQDAEFLERGRDSMRDWLRRGWKKLGCTALLVHNDRAAIGALEALREAGICVPDDVSVIGFDSTDECDLCMPRLSSVHVPLFDIGARATEILLQLIRDENSVIKEKQIVLPATLQKRDSCSRPQAVLSSIQSTRQ